MITITEELSKLKATARTAQDIEHWMKDNLQLLGMIPPKNRNDAEVNLGFNLHEAFNYSASEVPIIKTNVAVTVSNNAQLNPELAGLLQAQDSFSSNALSNFRIFLSFDAWPFLTARLAMLHLQGQLLVTPNSKQRSDEILAKYVPLHFQGMTWLALQGLYNSDLLPMLDPERLDEPATLEVLFALHKPANTLSLPTNMSV